jgi:hypothetical protein
MRSVLLQRWRSGSMRRAKRLNGAVLLGALGAMLPDPLQIAHKLYPREPLRSLQRFHVWIHTKQQLSWPIGVSSQLSFIVLVVVIFAALRGLSA